MNKFTKNNVCVDLIYFGFHSIENVISFELVIKIIYVEIEVVILTGLQITEIQQSNLPKLIIFIWEIEKAARVQYCRFHIQPPTDGYISGRSFQSVQQSRACCIDITCTTSNKQRHQTVTRKPTATAMTVLRVAILTPKRTSEARGSQMTPMGTEYCCQDY